MLDRLEVLRDYLAEALLKPEENVMYIDDLVGSIVQEQKRPTKNYTQECTGLLTKGDTK